MPWKETCAMEERMKFIIDCKKQGFSKAALCRIFGISRPTGDKWLARKPAQAILGVSKFVRRANWPAECLPGTVSSFRGQVCPPY
ncbi:MAG: helix-turn-helix domain-containing protein [Phycisphaerae bacterium]|nr:helix-turn-helix domain-containing protein [Phycisphaerae bacterium]